MSDKRHVLAGDLDWLEYAIADYVAKWGEHLTGQPYQGEFGTNIAGIPCAVANMAMTVIRKNIVASWTENQPNAHLVDPGKTSTEAAQSLRRARRAVRGAS